MPGKHRIGGEQAVLFIGSIRASIDALNGNDHAHAPKNSAAKVSAAAKSMMPSWPVAPLSPGQMRSIAGGSGTTRY
jgi:hypothetical protein